MLFSCSVMPWLFVTPWTTACQAFLSFTISQSLPKFTFIVSVMPSIHLILWHSLFHLPSIFPSIRDFSNESSAHIRWPKYWSFSKGPSSEYPGSISLKIDCFDLPSWVLGNSFICGPLCVVSPQMSECVHLSSCLLCSRFYSGLFFFKRKHTIRKSKCIVILAFSKGYAEK